MSSSLSPVVLSQYFLLAFFLLCVTLYRCLSAFQGNWQSYGGRGWAIVRVHPVHLTECSMSFRWLPTFGPSRSASANRSTDRQLQWLHSPSPFIITQLDSWYSFYYSTEGRRLSQPSWLALYRDGLPACGQSPIQVLIIIIISEHLYSALSFW